MNKGKQHFAVYSLKDDKILKDGHTMFTEDVVRDLNRKSFLESERVNKATITHVDLERLLKMSLRYALPSNGSSPSVVADLFRAHICELRTDFIEWAGESIFHAVMSKLISDINHHIWIDLRCFLDGNMVRREDYK